MDGLACYPTYSEASVDNRMILQQVIALAGGRRYVRVH